MATIYLDARNITAQPAGVARYALNLIPELVRQGNDHRFVAIRHRSNQEPINVSDPARYAEVFVDLPIDEIPNVLFGRWMLRRVFEQNGAPDIFHDLFHILPWGLSCPVVVTLHDLIWIDHPGASQPHPLRAELLRTFARLAIPYALRASDHVICVSEPTAHRARAWLRRGHFSVIAHGVESRFFRPHSESELLRKALTNSFDSEDSDGLDEQPLPPYIVAVGNAKRYKNLHTLLKAFAQAQSHLGDTQVVLVGQCDGLSGLISELGISSKVVRLGFLNEKALCEVVGQASLFVFPSWVEGFGLPVLEAMALGVPTAVSDLEPMRSVGGQAAMRFDPHDPGALAELLRRFFGSPNLQKHHAQAGPKRAAQFRWPLTAQKTLEVYARVLGS